MGLDMFLNRKTYIGSMDYSGDKPKRKIKVIVLDSETDEPVKDINLEKVNYTEEEVAYWRKANHIHQWFVDNVQNGNDDCGEYIVEEEQLESLINDCEAVLADDDLAPQLLPTQSGFFFGGTEYDEYYYESLKDTIKMLKPVLKEAKESKLSQYFYYRSSW